MKGKSGEKKRQDQDRQWPRIVRERDKAFGVAG